jgi:hypothetical protein
MPLNETSGNVTTDAFGGGVAVVPNYIEDVFSTWLYTGNSSTQTITNGIDLSTKGGLVWVKNRNNVYEHQLVDTIRGVNSQLNSASTDAPTTETNRFSSFNSNGFSLNGSDRTNGTGLTYASWTWRKQPKFFDVVTYTGNSVAGRTVAHNLGSVPGCIIVKRLTGTWDWRVYHRGLTSAAYGLSLNLTTSQGSDNSLWNSTAPTSTVFSLGDSNSVNSDGAPYVAYVFAHNAGGFGLTGTDNVISCGSFTVSSNVATVSLGYEPQWTMMKQIDSTDNWRINDVMRGSPTAGGTNASLQPDSSAVESFGTAGTNPTATGFTVQGIADGTYIYIAIRRGPMKVPTLGTSVFKPMTRAGTGTATTVTGVGFTPDFIMPPSIDGGSKRVYDRLRGPLRAIYTNLTDAEATETDTLTGFDVMDGVKFGNSTGNVSGTNYIDWFFRRAPSFFDEVCYTGTGVNRTLTHNLAAAPELWIVKLRGAAAAWAVGSTALANTEYLLLNTTDAKATGATYWNSTYPTATTLSLGTNARVNDVGSTAVAYLFATCAGVSKVGTYTGNGSTQTINCGFGAGGARFVLIKRTDSTGDWYIYDTARGMTTLTDPYLLLNSTAAESATLGSVTTVSTGFALNASILSAINTSSATYIFLAIA